MNSVRSKFAHSALSVLAVTSVSACTSSAESPAVVSDAPPSVQAVLDVSQWTSADFDPVWSTDDLASVSEIVAQGVVVAVRPGPTVGNPSDALADLKMAIIEIGEVTLVKGILPATSDGELYVPIVAPSGAEAYADVLPVGSAVVFYGRQIMNEESDGDVPLIDASAGRPAGQPVFRLAHPQGLVIDVSAEQSGELIWPDAGTWAESSIDEALPGGSESGRPND
ncbi:MAG: hypothetical protein HGA51_06075 [Demequinaceae bacterium]|nr:hypothetical protein [Demequinaceae bacterium]